MTHDDGVKAIKFIDESLMSNLKKLNELESEVHKMALDARALKDKDPKFITYSDIFKAAADSNRLREINEEMEALNGVSENLITLKKKILEQTFE